MLRHRGRSTRFAIGMAFLSMLASGCGTQSTTSRPVVASDVCKPHRTLVCRKHHGKVYRCSCQSKEALRDLLEPVPY